jgi:hypothetical protein
MLKKLKKIILLSQCFENSSLNSDFRSQKINTEIKYILVNNTTKSYELGQLVKCFQMNHPEISYFRAYSKMLVDGES